MGMVHHGAPGGAPVRSVHGSVQTWNVLTAQSVGGFLGTPWRIHPTTFQVWVDGLRFLTSMASEITRGVFRRFCDPDQVINP